MTTTTTEFPIEINVERREVLLKETNEIFVLNETAPDDMIHALYCWFADYGTYYSNKINIMRNTFGKLKIIDIITLTGGGMSNKLTIGIDEHALFIDFMSRHLDENNIPTNYLLFMCANKLEPLILK